MRQDLLLLRSGLLGCCWSPFQQRRSCFGRSTVPATRPGAFPRGFGCRTPSPNRARMRHSPVAPAPTAIRPADWPVPRAAGQSRANSRASSNCQAGQQHDPGQRSCRATSPNGRAAPAQQILGLGMPGRFPPAQPVRGGEQLPLQLASAINHNGWAYLGGPVARMFILRVRIGPVVCGPKCTRDRAPAPVPPCGHTVPPWRPTCTTGAPALLFGCIMLLPSHSSFSTRGRSYAQQESDRHGLTHVCSYICATPPVTGPSRVTPAFNRHTVQRYRQWARTHGLLTDPLPSLEQIQATLTATLPPTPPPQNVSSVALTATRCSPCAAQCVEVAALYSASPSGAIPAATPPSTASCAPSNPAPRRPVRAG